MFLDVLHIINLLSDKKISGNQKFKIFRDVFDDVDSIAVWVTGIFMGKWIGYNYNVILLLADGFE